MQTTERLADVQKRLQDERFRRIAAMKQEGLTQVAIAAQLGITQSAVSRLLQRAQKRGYLA